MMRKMSSILLHINKVSLICCSSSVCRKESFALVGARGAGKSTIIRMMMAKEKPTVGSSYVNGENVLSNVGYLYRNVGYCPQMNPLIDELTGRETLKIFCLIGGIAKASIPTVTTNISEALGFHKHLDVKIKRYDVSNKRRLSIALAILRSPPILYLDEPTHSIDPVACRQIWNVLRLLREQGKSILITTKSMEECNEVCNNVAVIVNGQLKCFGSIFHLKNKFSSGIKLKIKVAEGKLHKGKKSYVTPSSTRTNIIINTEYNLKRVKRFVERKYERAVLR